MTGIETPDFSYLCYGCQELANNARTKAYVQWAASIGAWADQDCCVEMPHDCWCPNDGLPSEFSDPITDDACWYDALIPESSEFLGLYVTKVSGLRDSTYARSATENIGRGVTLGRARSGSRIFTIEAILIATSCCGMDYGMSYVRRVLEGGGCGVGSCLTGCGDLGSCGLTCLTGRVCCPDDIEVEDSGLRQWVNVGLVDGLKDIDDQLTSCRCCLRKVTFTIQAETPESYSLESVICLDKDADLENIATRCFDWDNGCPDDQIIDECTDDPFCPPDACIPPLPPQRVNYCFCEPMGVSVDCCCAIDLPNHRDETFRITLNAGLNPNNGVFTQYGMRNARIKFYTNDPRKPCPSDDEAALEQWGQADLCALLEIPYLKPGAQLVIDGRTDTITIECDAQCYPGWASVFGPNGADPFPLLASCHGLSVCVEWDLNGTQFVDDPGIGAVRSHIKIERFKVYA